jgi:stage V sporulation protein B
LFGYLSGMAQPLFMMSLIPTISIAASLVPSVTAAFTMGNSAEIKEHKTPGSFKIMSADHCTGNMGMYALAEPVSKVLYGTVKAAPVIANLAPSIIFLGIFQVTTGALQGWDKRRCLCGIWLGGAVVSIVAIWLLTSCPVTWNILGAAWASNINYMVVALSILFVLWRVKIIFPGGVALNILQQLWPWVHCNQGMVMCWYQPMCWCVVLDS